MNRFKLKYFNEEYEQYFPEIKKYNQVLRTRNKCILFLFMYFISTIVGYIFRNGFHMVKITSLGEIIGYLSSGILLIILLAIIGYFFFSYGFIGLFIGIVVSGIFLTGVVKFFEFIFALPFISSLVNIPVSGEFENMGAAIIFCVLTIIPLIVIVIKLVKSVKLAPELYLEAVAAINASTYEYNNVKYSKNNSSNNKSHNREKEEQNYKQSSYNTSSHNEDINNFFAGCKTVEDAKKRRRELSNIYHPDKNNGDTTMMQKINTAYDEFIKTI